MQRISSQVRFFKILPFLNVVEMPGSSASDASHSNAPTRVYECIFSGHDGTRVRVMPAESVQRNFAIRRLVRTIVTELVLSLFFLCFS